MNRGSKIKQLFLLIPTFIGMGLTVFLYYYFNEKVESLPNPVKFTNHRLPDSKLLEIEGSDASSKIREGRVLLVFLSSKCVACKKDVRTISTLYPKLYSKIKIYGVAIEKKEDILKFANENSINFPILFDINAELFNKLKIQYFPTKFLLEDGVIVTTLLGNFPNQDKVFEDLKISK